MSIVHAGAVLTFDPGGGQDLQVGTSPNPQAAEPDAWLDQDRVSLEVGTVKVFARATRADCPGPQVFAQVYEVRESYPPPPGDSLSTAIAMEDPRILHWADDFRTPVAYGGEVLEQFRTPELALGPAAGTSTDVVSLGRGGEIVLSFDPPAADGQGYDLAVFENGITDSFLELGFVEVSSDGKTFLRFDHATLSGEPVDAFGSVDTTLVGGLAGKYRQGFGTPFDLSTLQNRPEVLSGRVDLQDIRFVKIVDLIGDGESLDSFGSPLFDPYPTVESAGFDLEAVGVLGSAPDW